MQPRYKSKVMWTSIFAGLFMIYNAVAQEYGYPTIPDGAVGVVIDCVLGALVTFGIVNNPTDRNNL